MRGQCPECGTQYDADDSAIGQSAACPTCGKTIVIVPMTKQAPAAAGTPSQVLADFQKASRAPVGVGFFGRLKAGMHAGAERVKLKAEQLQTRREIGNLQKAIVNQFVGVAAQALSSPPAGLDLDRQIAELATVQQELKSKQAQLVSLQQAKATGSVLKELRGEIVALQEQQTKLMTAIGQDVANYAKSSGQSMPATIAVERLEQSLQVQQDKLKQIDEALAAFPPTDGKAMGRKLIMVAAAIVVVLLAIWAFSAVTEMIFGGSSIDDYAHLFPKKTNVVGYIDLGKLVAEQDEYVAVKDLGYTADDLLGEMARKLHFRRLKAEELKDVCFGVNVDKDEGVIIVRLKTKTTLKDLFDKDDVKFETYEDFDYVSIDQGYMTYQVAELKPGVLVFTESRSGGWDSSEAAEPAIEAILDREIEGAKADLSDELRKAMAKVKGYDAFIASANLEDAPVDWAAGGVSMGSSITFTASALFDDEAEAKDLEESFNEGKQEFLDGIEDELDDLADGSKDDMKAIAKQVADLVEALELSRSGKQMTLSGKWKRSQLNRLFEDLPKSLRNEFKRNLDRQLR